MAEKTRSLAEDRDASILEIQYNTKILISPNRKVLSDSEAGSETFKE